MLVLVLMHFNSKMVRLKVSDVDTTVERVDTFQFQDGSIKSNHVYHNHQYIRHFNSKMVRLKDVQNYKNHSENKGI